MLMMKLCKFFALLLADYVAAKRCEFHRDFLFSHRIARAAQIFKLVRPTLPAC